MTRTSSPPRVRPEVVRMIMERPPYWLSGSYLRAYRDGRLPVEVLAYAVVAACGGSAYDDEVVDDVADILRGLGYRESCAPPPFERSLTDFSQGDERRAIWT